MMLNCKFKGMVAGAVDAFGEAYVRKYLPLISRDPLVFHGRWQSLQPAPITHLVAGVESRTTFQLSQILVRWKVELEPSSFNPLFCDSGITNPHFSTNSPWNPGRIGGVVTQDEACLPPSQQGDAFEAEITTTDVFPFSFSIFGGRSMVLFKPIPALFERGRSGGGANKYFARKEGGLVLVFMRRLPSSSACVSAPSKTHVESVTTARRFDRGSKLTLTLKASQIGDLLSLCQKVDRLIGDELSIMNSGRGQTPSGHVITQKGDGRKKSVDYKGSLAHAVDQVSTHQTKDCDSDGVNFDDFFFESGNDKKLAAGMTGQCDVSGAGVSKCSDGSAALSQSLLTVRSQEGPVLDFSLCMERKQICLTVLSNREAKNCGRDRPQTFPDSKTTSDASDSREDRVSSSKIDIGMESEAESLSDASDSLSRENPYHEHLMPPILIRHGELKALFSMLSGVLPSLYGWQLLSNPGLVKSFLLPSVRSSSPAPHPSIQQRYSAIVGMPQGRLQDREASSVPPNEFGFGMTHPPPFSAAGKDPSGWQERHKQYTSRLNGPYGHSVSVPRGPPHYHYLQEPSQSRHGQPVTVNGQHQRQSWKDGWIDYKARDDDVHEPDVVDQRRPQDHISDNSPVFSPHNSWRHNLR